jgi:hypothetical protein
MFYGCKYFISFDSENILVLWEYNVDQPLKVLHFGFTLSSISIVGYDGVMKDIYGTVGNYVLNL